MSQMYWWLERVRARGSAANTASRKLPKLPLQFAARCSLLKSSSDLRKSDCLSTTAVPVCFIRSPLCVNTIPLESLEQVCLPRSRISWNAGLKLSNDPFGLTLTRGAERIARGGIDSRFASLDSLS